MADFARGTVAVIREAVDYNSDSAGSVALVNAVFIVVLFIAAGSLFEKSVDVVVGNIVGFCLLNERRKLRVIRGVRASRFLNADEDFAAYFRENLCSCAVFFAFFAFNRTPPGP